MVAAIQRFALFLNQNTNLLLVLANVALVLVTGANVWLTRQTLRALRETSLREREARHLQEIKENVIQPIVSWIRMTVFGRFTSESPGVLTVVGGYRGISRHASHTVDDPFVDRCRLATSADPPDSPDILTTWSSLEHGRIPKFLYDHTKRDHFPEELRKFDRLLEDVRQLTGGLTSFANQCAKDMVCHEIPQALLSEDENSMSEWANSYLLVAGCIQALLLGKKSPEIDVRSLQNSYELTTTIQNQPVARGTQPDKLKHWYKLGSEQVRHRWEASGLPEKVGTLLRRADGVLANIEHLLFHQSLDVDCELVSGKKHRRWYAPWIRL
jgi:hypothetical protein